MDLTTIFDFFNKFGKDNLSFLYHGFFSDEFTEKIISINETNIEKNQDISSVKGKISFLVAESFQNIVRHGSKPDSEEKISQKKGIFIIRHIENSFYITSANVINNKFITHLSEQLQKINQLDKEGLKELYQDMMANTGFSEKGGAGLGLIEMARKSGHKLEFEFDRLDEEFSYFYLQIVLHSKAINQPPIEKHEIDIAAAKECNTIMSRNNIFMAYKGNFSQDTVLPILKIIERNLQVNQLEHITVKRAIFILLTELLQNISKHGKKINDKRDGIFLIGKYRTKYIISTGNFIDNSQIDSLKDNIDKLNSLEKEELNNLYINKLREGTLTEEGDAGLGLIDIAKESNDKIRYNFSFVNDETSFVTICIYY